MSTRSTKPTQKPKAPKAKPKRAQAPRSREPGTAMVPKHPRAWMRRYRCGCTHEFPLKDKAYPWCPEHLRDPSGDAYPVFEGDKPPPAPEGRPTKFSTELAERVCKLVGMGWRQRDFKPERGIPKLVAMGYEPEEAARFLDTLPGMSTLARWLVEHDEFRVLYGRAKLAFVEHGMGEECEEIADDATQDMILTTKGLMVDHEHISRSKLRVEQRRWTMERMMPLERTLRLKGDADAPLLVGKAGAYQLTDAELQAELIARRDERRTLPPPERED